MLQVNKKSSDTSWHSYHDASVAGNFNATSINTGAGLGKEATQWGFALPLLVIFLKARTSVWKVRTKCDVRDLGPTQNNLQMAHLVFCLSFCIFDWLYTLNLTALSVPFCLPLFLLQLDRIIEGRCRHLPLSRKLVPSPRLEEVL